jgi:hypothetical protein
MTLPHDSVTEIIDNLTELKRMYQLNLELLEQLAVTCDWLHKSGVHLPNESVFFSLLNKTTTLLDEIQADTPKTLQYKKLTDKKKHPIRTDEDVPEPVLFSIISYRFLHLRFLNSLAHSILARQ